MLALEVAFVALIASFFISLLIYCLRMGVVGGGYWPWQSDAHRSRQPIRYWTGIAALALGASFSLGCFIYDIWILLT